MNNLKAEKKHLADTYQQLLTRKTVLNSFLTEGRKKDRLAMQSIGEEIRLNFDNFADRLDTFAAIESKNREIDQMNAALQSAERELAAIDRLLDSPYFGKISLQFEDEETIEDFYIGINGFVNENKEGLIYDWRSPIAELFYAKRLGPVSYQVNNQTISAVLEQRRQFIIEKDQLKQAFDTSVAIQDDVLLAALEANNSQKMQDITASIQHEQNVIIRDLAHKNLLVNGVAGSGKTSAVMQRIAFLLYHFREEMTAENVLILSPNSRFIDYISQVLPSLGEKNPLTLTMRQFCQAFPSVDLESEEGYFDRIQQAPSEAIELLRSADFSRFLQSLSKQLPEELVLQFKPIKRKNVVLFSEETIDTFFQETPKQAPLRDRIQAVKKKLAYAWEERLQKNALAANVHDQVRSLTEDEQQSLLGTVLKDDSEKTIQKAALRLLKKKYAKVTKQINDLTWFDTKQLLADSADYFTHGQITLTQTTDSLDYTVCLLLIRHLVAEKQPVPALRYLFIDEVQDYTPAQLQFLLCLFPMTAFTLVGDQQQAIFTSAITVSEIQTMFQQQAKSLETYQLTTSYRSSGVITRLFAQMLPKETNLKISAVRPAGKLPQFYANLTDVALVDIVKELKQPVTIITKDSRSSEELKQFFDKQAVSFHGTVLPIHLAKGLEFKQVLLYDVSAENYHTDQDQRILYTAISRAMEELMVTSKTTFSTFLTI
ncbi:MULTISPECIES: HelD family protein [Enterococcus]|uniref:UvrD-helicase domain-containing protein n=1 Tax=Enterococcus entomosocium TaxID=3034352 RepID=A0ABV3MG14_9ENTE|nr:UvrD-helicase domain-containing protein [Enterococcus casseliflavus]MDB1707972.1 AAA family ATPase [Enterococcus casseliflavus]MDB1716769.1 AAA family ATPase [Enterococcus casseliflavus]